MALDPAILALLKLDPSRTTVVPSGKGSSSASTSKITARFDDGSEKSFFLKTLTGELGPLLVHGMLLMPPMFIRISYMVGEHASLQAIHSAVPDLCPQSYGFGTLREAPSTSFLVLEFIQLSPPSFPSAFMQTLYRRASLATELGKLHSTPAPVPNGHTRPQFGFPITTCCGDTPQDNSYKDSWAQFFVENRLQHMLMRVEKKHGEDCELRRLVEGIVARVVPRLIGDDHLNNGKRVTPVVVHGDLWSGNACMGVFAGGKPQEVVYGPSSCYAHSEYEIGIMRMFGGFGSSFFTEYHKHVPKTEPVDEYEDRIVLYEM